MAETTELAIACRSPTRRSAAAMDFLHELGLSQVVALITREHIEMFLERQLAATLESLPLHDVPGLTPNG